MTGTAHTDRRAAHTLALAMLGLSLLAALAFLSVRNLYDDELTNIAYFGLTPSQMIAVANAQDLHPPGQYLLTALAHWLIPDVRWMTLLPLAFLYTGLAAFCLRVAPLLPRGRARVSFLLLACLHPQLMMWGNTVRWYSWWTGLVLLALTLTLQPGEPRPALTYRRALLLGLLTAALFYLNYVTLLFLPALLASIARRYGRRAWRPAALLVSTAALLAIPQLHAMTAVHMAHTQAQRGAPLLSAARLALALLASEACLPWSPLALLATLAGVALAVSAALRLVPILRHARKTRHLRLPRTSLAALLLFAGIFAMLLAVSGLGNKPRNCLLLAPALAPAAALLIARIRPAVASRGVLILYAVWSATGLSNLLLRQHVGKGSMIDHPEQLIAALRQQDLADAKPSACRIAITYDNPLALQLVLARLPRTAVLTTTQLRLYRTAAPLPPDCSRFELIWITTYLDLTRRANRDVLAEVTAAARTLPPAGPAQAFSHDPDAATKRRLAWLTGISNLPDDRIVAHPATATPAQLTAILAALPHFTLADGVTAPQAE